ncbi:rhomboid family intramembrane serine protease [Hyphomicrobium sp. NDB2Meth4]|uniref:rhomboid family intramembrane serine protease n=1 Tax=Hyphomicrobium sp. NDB2Meth4 TaxID=1892846 RepID=UPI000931018D|nr:rhomboid family intramembrane serine protease [Hyphomicrobium sp. NDB2Meth4]
MERHEPMFNIHGAVLGLLGAMIAVHVVRLALPENWDAWLTWALAFVPARYAGYAAELPGGDVTAVTSFLTHTLVHGDWVHLGLNAAWLVAFGGAVANRVGAVRFLALFAFCSVIGAVTFLIFNPGLLSPMVGASGGISGLMGATMRFLFPAIDGRGLAALREDPGSVRAMPLLVTLSDKRVVAVTAVFLAANILAVLGIGSVGLSGIAWEAHIGGYFAGLLFFGFFDAPQTDDSSEQDILH